MDVFCRNVPTHVKKHHLKKELTPILADFDILAFECRVHAKGGHATITISDIDKATRFLTKYQQKKGPQKKGQELKIFGTTIFVEEGRHKPDPFLLSSLQNEETERRSRPHRPMPASGGSAVHVLKKFPIFNLSCGRFVFSDTGPVFVERWKMASSGHVKFGPTKMTVTITQSMYSYFKLDFNYLAFDDCIYLGDNRMPSITFSLHYSPHMYNVPFPTLPPHPRAARLMASSRPADKKTRLGFLDPDHKLAVSSCFVYRVVLANPSDLSLIPKLSSNRNIPPFERWNDTLFNPDVPYATELQGFLVTLSKQSFPFIIKFQLQMLVWNGELPMMRAVELFPFVKKLLSRRKDEYVAKIIKDLPRRLVHPTPHADIADVRLDRIVETLHQIEDSHALDYFKPGHPGYLHHNQVEIHRASVTPSGIYLDGPNPEAQNRVLRKYSAYSSYFLRVRFIEESGDMMMYDMSSNLDEVFRGRFREVLRDGIIIAGRHYVCLGFSHSSLRSRTCWFMAPFEDCGEVITVEKLIPRLGDFTHIRSPAKLAARLGQTFSDTLTSIPIEKHMVKKLPDVERNGRVFSDGCGTISKEILRRIHRDYPRDATVCPTVFQIRFSGKITQGLTERNTTSANSPL